MIREIKGRHVLAMFLAGFGTIIAVNVTMAVQAVRTFPGLEVASSYVASQEFDARRAAQEALGWTATADYAGGALAVRVEGAEPPARIGVRVGRPTTAPMAEARVANGDRVALDLAPGLWRVDVTAAAADGTAFETHLSLRVARE